MGTLRVRWVANAAPELLPVTQVSGFCFDREGQILLIEDAGEFGLPGGTPEKSESYEETLRREVLEEAQVVLDEVKFLGYQLVEGDASLINGRPYAQIRAIARVAQILPSAEDPASGVTFRRLLCPPAVVPGLLGWGNVQLAAACHLTHQIWALPC
jgi:ADP-ribose pyrophosphatase YjhB (NUDIX family)